MNHLPFAGTYDKFKIDSKGRLSIPVKWRERLGNDFYMVVLTSDEHKFLALYPVSDFEEILKNLDVGTQNERRYNEQEIFLNTEECSLDAQGRFTLNERFKQMTGIKNDSPIILYGSRDKIELWNKEEFINMRDSRDSSLGIFDLLDKTNNNSSNQNGI